MDFLTRKPARFQVAALLTASVSCLFGFDTGTIGPITTMKQFTNEFGPVSSTVHGLIVSSILLPAAATSIFAGHLADRVGRPRGIAIGAAIYGIGSALECAAVNLAMLFVGRLVAGLGEGLYLSTLIVYICEISPPAQRGVLAAIPQAFIAFSLVAGYFICYGSASISSSLSWRLPFAVSAGMGLAFATLAAFSLPESPRWLALAGRSEQIDRAWDILGVEDADREEALAADEQRRAVRDHGYQAKPKGIDMLLTVFKKDVRSRTLLGLFMMSMQQLAGIDGVLYYAPLLFQQAGLSSERASFLASGVSAILIFAVSLPAFLLTDHWGRRTATIWGGCGVISTMIVVGALYATDSVHQSTGAGRWIVIVMIYLFVIIFSATWAISIKIYASEIQPPHTRASASSLAYTFNWIANFGVALTTPIFLAHSSSGVYFLYAGFTILAVVVCILFMPETSGRTLESINASFHTDIPALKMKKLLKTWSRRDQPGLGMEDPQTIELDEMSPRLETSKAQQGSE